MSMRESGRRALGAAAIPPESSRPRAGGLAHFVAAFFVAWTIRAFALVEWDDHLRPFLLRRIYLDSVRVALWVVPVFLYLRYVDRIRPLPFLGITTRPDAPAVLRGVVLSAIYLALGLLVGVLVEGRRLVPPWALGRDRWVEMVLTLPIACFAEEVFFRGFLLTKTRDLMGPWRAVLLTSLLFAAIHWPGWIASGGLRREIGPMSASVFGVGVLLGYLFLTTRSLWPSVVVHVLNNVVSGFLLQSGV